jgi:phosphoribosylformimino-5-aminoimidazole carboxamide ribotide isomerase
MQIIPAIDVIDGQCVRLTKGDYAAMTVYYKNPVDAAKQFEEAGLQRLHLVDLDGAKEGAVKNLAVLEAIAAQTRLQVDFSGGIKTGAVVQQVFDAGAAFVAVGSIAVKNKELFAQWLQQFGADRFMVGADVLEGKIKISGWLEDAQVYLDDFLADMMGIGVRQFFCTDIAKDGAMAGPSIALYQRIIHQYHGIQLIASGGVTTLHDLQQLAAIGCSGAIVGKAIYEKTITLTDLAKFNN